MKPQQMNCRIVMLILGILLLSPLNCLGEWRDLSAQELKEVLDSVRKIFLINPLSDIEFNQGHIPGSVNIPLHTIMRSNIAWWISASASTIPWDCTPRI